MSSEYRDDEEAGPRVIPPLTDYEGSDGEAEDRNLNIQSDSEPSNITLPVPIWLRESAKNFRYKWVPLPIRKAARATVTWVKGPIPPRELKIVPYFAKIQQAPVHLLDKYMPKKRHRIFLLILFYAAWFLTWSLMLKHHSTSGYIKGYGRPANLWCGANLWRENNGCGLNGNDCRPFSTAHITFRCPANCEATHLLEERFVGNKSLRYQDLVIGGPDPADPDSLGIYRADSFICQAAIHAGIITEAAGGCGVATLTGSHTNFPASKAHGIQSVAFPGTFPRSYTFQKLSPSQAKCPTDSRWPLFAVTAVALVVLSIFTTSPAAFFFSSFVILIFHVGMVSDPPNMSNVYELLSLLFSRLLPATFISFILYKYCAIPLLTGLTAQIEKTVLYLGFCFIGALNNYTFAPLIPIERLTPHDLAQPGAPFALAIIITIILIIIIFQIHYIRISGNMPKYLAIYATIGLGLIILLTLPGLRVRIHHYILALIFMPGTGFQTRPSLIYQGLLLGLFINGVARWGFSSIIQTPAALGEGGGHGRSWWGAQAPNVTAAVGADRSNITFTWGKLPAEAGVDGVSILINDVERWRGYTDDELYWNQDGVTLPRQRRKDRSNIPEIGQDGSVEQEQVVVMMDTNIAADKIDDSGEEEMLGEWEPEFFRFAWMNGANSGKYSRPGVWDVDGKWIPPK